MNWIVILIAALMAIMGIVILIGKGDNLIAGYNTASQKEKSKYNIKRLRLLIGGFLILLAPVILISLGKETMEATGIFMAGTVILCFVLIFLANTWAKRK
ncbi:MAG: DUF3784 domain-containing protein [Bacteroidales bacterium]|nr:DUF3784 domain-containing protein [Bacteroidales bacterium]